jgi:3-methyladenine DNA glycosylase AlkD
MYAAYIVINYVININSLSIFLPQLRKSRMKKKEVLQWMEENKDERGIRIMERTSNGVKSFGLGMTKLKALAKKIGKNQALALELWDEAYYDTRILATLIADPAVITRNELEKWIMNQDAWMISYSIGSNLLPHVPFLIELSEDWAQSPNNHLRRCGYLGIVAICKANTVLPDEYFEPYLEIIEKNLQAEENFVKDAMNTALMAIGSHSKWLNSRALVIAEKIGKVEVDYGDNSCVVPDALKHLTSEKVSEKFAEKMF